MYLTIRLKIGSGGAYLERSAERYTKALCDCSDIVEQGKDPKEVERRYGLSGEMMRKITREAFRRNRMIRLRKIRPEDPVPEHCVYPAQHFSLDLPRRVIRFHPDKDRVWEFPFRTDRYRMVLLNELRPLSLRIEQRDGIWYGWLLGYIREDAYWDARDFIKKERTSYDKGPSGSSLSNSGTISM